MKIELKNFGPIDHFEFDLDKDLYVIYGENNLGKSYAMSAVYLILKNLLFVSEKNFNVQLKDLIRQSVAISFPTQLTNNRNAKGVEILLSSSQGASYQIRLNDSESPTLTLNEFMDVKDLYFLKKYSLHYLPASRSGLYNGINSLSPIIAQLSQLRNSIKETISIPTYSEPISDYFLLLTSINQLPKNEPITSIVEKKILKGEVIFDKVQRKLLFKQEGLDFDLELSQTSSMIAEIAPLVAFIKYIVTDKSILFIEEPEAHLHPKIQVEMMKVFVELVKAGVKVVMTTHSDYMKDTLSNLLLAGEISPDKVASYHFVMGENGSYDAGDMKATEEGIEDHNFTSVSVALYEERMKLLEKRYAGSHD